MFALLILSNYKFYNQFSIKNDGFYKTSPIFYQISIRIQIKEMLNPSKFIHGVKTGRGKKRIFHSCKISITTKYQT
ncbi:hypothetical protein EV695_2459 [Cocleimonas flava]|uniref:Uncharacterized protein n=1 Tax=Cocleimonas flava TaxID=634765 RepID=A0A4R1EWY5_9GAMM|nr:hypothetical protein EV695_2459 [Cocleimonas flava]